ncbi:MAG: CbiX/SirB N-terminal domain-containing protein [Gammaproteobacteria bacterium]|nr:CbiX/SirB N-terminal domain-containing protein [Gammaproteobacteria bacterium]MCY4218296.1 CbiX/SirB N-terminal domain-containing protein [Gammaproteobacteria bacterium]MCY4276050.1 CbiX/SirB N-terminal domain-containing protein [Gammaproteobacteria bacterium]
MKALLIVAHGSRNPNSNRETEALTEAIRNRELDYEVVEHAYLELAEPTIPSAAASLVERGVDSITLVPLFLASGNHVERDMPAIIDDLKNAYPNSHVTMKPHIGSNPSFVDLIVDHITEKH